MSALALCFASQVTSRLPYFIGEGCWGFSLEGTSTDTTQGWKKETPESGIRNPVILFIIYIYKLEINIC